MRLNKITNSQCVLRFALLLFSSLTIAAPVNIGKMDRFYAHGQLQGEWLSIGLNLIEVPEYLMQTSFPYRKRPYPKEILFQDTCTFTRILGGWIPTRLWSEDQTGPEADIVYRGEDGKLKYRWEKLEKRLRPYIDAGYTDLTFTLDNTPFCLAAEPNIGDYGQKAPPADFEEWGEFVEDFCLQLIKLYGYETASKFRFKQGNEIHRKHQFTGTQEEFFKQYDYSAAAIKKVFPNAEFGPGEYIVWPAKDPGDDNISYQDLADHCVNGINAATGEKGIRFDFLPLSAYGVETDVNGQIIGIDPDVLADKWKAFYDSVTSRHKQLKNISREIHQYGIYLRDDSLAKFMTSEPGARGAAWFFHTMFNIRQAGLTRLQHWFTGDEVTIGGKKNFILNSHGWLFSILDYTIGSDIWVLDSPPQSPLGTKYKSIAACDNSKNRTIIITSAFHVDRQVEDPRKIKITVPQNILSADMNIPLKCVFLKQDSNVYAEIRKDLEKADLLKPEYVKIPGLVASLKEFKLDAKGSALIAEKYDKYEKMIVESLTLKPYEGELVENNDNYEFIFEMSPSSVMVIVAGAAAETFN